MGKIVLDISSSLDGFVAGPNPTLAEPLGENGESLHEWIFPLASWRQSHGLEGGEEGPASDMLADGLAAQGAVVMGRRMFSGGSGPWEDDPRATGWWGDEPPFRKPVFVLTHHEREPLTLGATTFTFVTDGVESAVERARTAAGENDVLVAGGAEAAQQVLGAGLLDEALIHVAPVLLGSGRRLFEGVAPAKLELVGVVDTPAATHLRYRMRA